LPSWASSSQSAPAIGPEPFHSWLVANTSPRGVLPILEGSTFMKREPLLAPRISAKLMTTLTPLAVSLPRPKSVLSLLLSVASNAAAVGQAQQRIAVKPNFLFVMVDDMAPDAIFHDRFDFLKTPNFQRLADEGAVFDNMMVTTSLCSPSRASILTGTYSHIHGVRYNEIQDPEPHLEQFPRALQKVGYKTAMIGKWHMAHHARPRRPSRRSTKGKT